MTKIWEGLLDDDAHVVAKYTVDTMKMQYMRGLETYFPRELTEGHEPGELKIHFFVRMTKGAGHFSAQERAIPVHDVADLTNTHTMQL